ncbi:TIGR00159 family protein [Picosynechococcus sp. PCC 7003]|uniref:diadenylate cyclase CdaA n=1 Tax=Picosynechococcus sp. PCC 7003 TaxID=374981 RepID=UPI000810C3CB|nr:diadenylate cyclase CdaA [Picosynechococcus sp. PCC 7003]ANV83001.1 TIGR00159 family protein [Picosynechococcus sp. PCC 7003]
MPDWLLNIADIALTVLLIYAAIFTRDQPTLRVIRGFLVLIIADKLASYYQLKYLAAVLDQLVRIAAVAIAVAYQSQLRQLLEKLGQGNIKGLLKTVKSHSMDPENEVLDRIVDAVKELSRSRTGALILIETSPTPIDTTDKKDFAQPGIPVYAEVSRELIQAIFYDKNPLHDGSILIRDSRIIAAKVFFKLSDKFTSRQLGSRHLAARSITERIEYCVCVVVSEETGSISLAQGGELNRPLTSSELKDLLLEYFGSGDRESVTPSLGDLGRQLKSQGEDLLKFLRQLNLPFTNKD